MSEYTERRESQTNHPVIVECDNCGTELHEVMFLVDDPANDVDAEVVCNHCGQETGTPIPDAHRRMEAL